MASNFLNDNRTEYTRVFGGFRGVDFSSEQNQVEDGRFCHLVNMWRDYESGQGDAIETIPGYRMLASLGGKINGIFHYRTREGADFVVVHAGTQLHRFLHDDRDRLTEQGVVTSFEGMEDARSSAFIFADKLYLLDGVHYYRLNGDVLEAVSDVAYVPTTYVNGTEYEQRNMLTDRVVVEETEAGGAQQVDAPIMLYVNEREENVSAVENHRYYGNGTKILRSDEILWYTSDGSQTLEVLILHAASNASVFSIGDEFLKECQSLKHIYFVNVSSREEFDLNSDHHFDETLLPEGCQVHWGEDYDTSMYYSPCYQETSTTENGRTYYDYYIDCSVVALKEKTRKVLSVKADDEEIPYNVVFETITEDDEENYNATKVVFDEAYAGAHIEVELECEPSTFRSAGDYLDFFTGNPEYKGNSQDVINRCTVQCHFDGRLFFTGNPDLPNTIFYTQRDLTGYNNPTYVGILNYMNDGVGNTPNTAMAASSGTLMVFKSDTAQDGSVYYHTGADTSYNVVPRIYPSTAGVPGVGCLGAAVNFYDDVCFLSRRGLEAIGKQTVNLERTVEHRSSNVDKLLAAEQLEAACVAEWKGYLVILCGSRAYLADSRQIFTHSTGVNQYEFYYMDDLCSYEDTREVFAGTEELPYVTVGDIEVHLGEFRFPDGGQLSPAGDSECIDRDEEDIYRGDIGYATEEGEQIRISVSYVKREDQLIYVAPTGEIEGVGEAFPASAVGTVNNVLYIGMADGTLVCMNTDKRGVAYGAEQQLVSVESDQIYRLWYTHAGRRYLSGFATAMDCANYPHLLKSTVKKSAVLKMKTLSGGGFRVMSRTDRTEWRQVQRSGGSISQVITADARGFDDVDFSKTGYNGTGGITIPIMEKEKKWVEKQLYLYSDGYAQPFGIFSLAYRFYITGRIKK